MALSKNWLYVICLSPLLGFLFPGLVWAGEVTHKPLPSPTGGAIVCPHSVEGDTGVIVCSGGGVYVIVGDEILVPVSPPEPAQQEVDHGQFPLELSDPYRGFPGSDLPAGVIEH